jgi:hypothetical protein
MELAAGALDWFIEQEVAELAATGASDAVLTDKRAELAAWRQDLLAALWLKFEGREPDAEE